MGTPMPAFAHPQPKNPGIASPHAITIQNGQRLQLTQLEAMLFREPLVLQ